MAMSKVKLIFCVVLSLMCWRGKAQQADYVQAEKFRKIGEEVGSLKVVPHYLKNSDKFWFSYKTGDGTRYYWVDPVQKTKSFLFENEYLAKELTRLTARPHNVRELPVKDLEFKKDERTLKFNSRDIQYEYDIYTRKLVRKDSVKKEPENKWALFSPDSAYIVFARWHNLFLMKNGDKDSVEIQLTTDGQPFYSYSYKERDTTGARQRARARWFKDSKKLYIVRSDNRRVKDLWVIDVLAARPKLEEYRYAMFGDREVPQYELTVIDLQTKKQTRINTEKWKDQSLRVLPAGKSSARIYFERRRRTCDELDICVADTETGESKVLINEKSKPYFNDQLYHCSILNEGKDIIWWSERDGWGHFYHYNAEGRLMNAITSGEWVAGKLIRIDTVGRVLYFEGYGREKGRNPYFAFVYRASIDGGGVTLLTGEDANHQTTMAQSCRYLVDNFSRVDLEPRSVLRDNKGNILMELARPDLKRLYETGWKMPERFTVKARDGVTDLYGVMWKPFDFDSTRSYPIISYVYPGPQTEAMTLDFSPSGVYNTALAQVGFIVVNFGHRGGSPQRDKWYHTFGYGNLRDYALADDKYGIEQLADRYSFINLQKVGIFGHSGGGFMSTAALCTYPDFYTAAVSSSGNHDNNIYNKWWGETHHGVREVKKTVQDSVKKEEVQIGFEAEVASNAELVRNFKGYLLLVTGDVDNNVHPGNTLRMADALIKAGKNFDLVMLPGQRHGYQGIQRDFYQRRMWFHFAKYLLGDSRADAYYQIDGFNRRN